MDKKSEHHDEDLVVIRANIDDMNPELIPPVIELLLESGAKDAFLIPVIMKKGRPGFILEVLTENDLLNSIETLIFTHTTTLGLRYHQATIHRLERSFQIVDTPWGQAKVKTGHFQGKIVQIAPEFEDCKKLSKQSKTPLPEIYSFIRNLF